MKTSSSNRDRDAAGPSMLVEALIAALVIVGLLFATSTFAAPRASDVDVDAGTVLLVANPAFEDPMWREGVLLAAPLPFGGHVGVFINRPTTATLAMLFPEHAPSRKVADPVYFGGPFMAQRMVAVVRAADNPGEHTVRLAEGLFLAFDAQTIDQVIERTPEAARYYVGLVLWRPGELREELAKNLWSVRGADTRTVFRNDMDRLWNELSQAPRGQVVELTRCLVPIKCRDSAR